MLSNFRHNHPIYWRACLVVMPFAAGVATYFAIATFAPSYPQSIRKFLDDNLQPLRNLPVVTQFLDPKPSTAPESPIDTLMKHYARLKTEPDQTQIVNDPLRPTTRLPMSQQTLQPEGVTWNSTNTGDTSPPPTLDMVNELDGPLFQLAGSKEANQRIRAIEALSGASGSQAVRACVEGLIDLDVSVRRHASRALIRANREVLYQEWVNIFQYGPIELFQALDAEVPELQEQLESSALAGLASGDSGRVQKIAAIYTLGRIRSDAALPLLAGYAWSDDIQLGRTATKALGEIKSPDAVGALADLTAHYDADVRWYAINGLGILKGEDALAALEAVIESGLEPLQEIRVLAINRLAEARDPGSIATLVDAMSRYPGLRYEAMYALSRITGIQSISTPFAWKEWYAQWSRTPDAQAALRKRRRIPATQLAVMPIDTAAPPQKPQTPTVEQMPTPNAKTSPVAEIAPVAPSSDAPSKPTSRKPLQVKQTGRGGSFGSSDLSPAELMRRGAFKPAKPKTPTNQDSKP